MFVMVVIFIANGHGSMSKWFVAFCCVGVCVFGFGVGGGGGGSFVCLASGMLDGRTDELLHVDF